MYPTVPLACYLIMFDCKLILLLIKLYFIRFIIQERDLTERATLRDFSHLFITKHIIVSNIFHRNVTKTVLSNNKWEHFIAWCLLKPHRHLEGIAESSSHADVRRGETCN